MKIRSLLFGIFLGLLPATTVVAEPVIPLRGDMGVLTDFRPNAAVWVSDDRILLADLRYNNLQIFDLEGRRFRLFEAPSMKAPAQYVGLARVADNEFLALGSHYQKENNPRYRTQRSTLQRIHLEGEDLQQSEHNLSPVESLRRTRMWGATPLRQLEFCGLATDAEHNVAWFGLARPGSEHETLELLRCPLDQLLAEDPKLEFTVVDTGFKLPLDGPSGQQTYLADIATIDDGSLLLLLTADDIDGRRFCSNSIWRWSPEVGGEATMVRENLAMENRAMGMAVRSLGDGNYKIALVCDNETELTGIPAALMVLDAPLTVSGTPSVVPAAPAASSATPPEAHPLNLESYIGDGSSALR